MTNIGREVVAQYRASNGKTAFGVIGTVVEEVKSRGKPYFKIKLADHMPRNAALGDYQLVGVNCEFADARRPVFAEPAHLGQVDMRQIARRQSYNR